LWWKFNTGKIETWNIRSDALDYFLSISMANIAAQRIKREFKEVIKSEEVGPLLTPWNYTF
jgi:hypothetical protein